MRIQYLVKEMLMFTQKNNWDRLWHKNTTFTKISIIHKNNYVIANLKELGYIDRDYNDLEDNKEDVTSSKRYFKQANKEIKLKKGKTKSKTKKRKRKLIFGQAKIKSVKKACPSDEPNASRVPVHFEGSTVYSLKQYSHPEETNVTLSEPPINTSNIHEAQAVDALLNLGNHVPAVNESST